MQSSFILGTFSYRTVITLGQYIFEGSEQRNLIGFLLQLQYDIWCVCVCFVLFPHSFRFKQKKKQRFFCDAFYSNSADSLHRPSHLVQKAHQRTKTEFKHELNRPIVKCIYSSYGSTPLIPTMLVLFVQFAILFNVVFSFVSHLFSRFDRRIVDIVSGIAMCFCGRARVCVTRCRIANSFGDVI